MILLPSAAPCATFKDALGRHKKLLAVYVVVVFLPALLLAVFGIRAIANERYKLRQRTFDEQRAFLADVKSEVADLIDRRASSLKGLASSPAFLEGDLGAIRGAISAGLQGESLIGEIVIWGSADEMWFPAFQESPPRADSIAVPEGWKALGPELREAETSEFGRGELSKAITRYRRLHGEAHDRRIKAWLLNRIARCEAKQGDRVTAAAIYRSLIETCSDLPTESGRPLELAARFELLDALLADRDLERFFDDSLETYSRLQDNPWSLAGAPFQFYADMLREKTEAALASAAAAVVPAGYRAAVENRQDLIDKRMTAWRLARTVRTDVLPGLTRDLEGEGRAEGLVLKTAFAFEDHDVVALIARLDRAGAARDGAFLGALLMLGDMKRLFDPLASQPAPPGVALVARSNLTGGIVFGSPGQDPPGARPVLTDVLQGSSLPWRLELYPAGPGGPDIPLYRNLFFWIILALLVILFIGSGLVVRTIVQEASLLKLKSDFIASVSHEFKTPLTAMGAILEHLLGGDVEDPVKTREYVGILQHDSDRLKRLVKNVLDFSKIEDGKRDYRLRPADVARLVEREIRSFEKESGTAGFRIGFRTDDGVSAVPLDEEAIGQALHNILDNAVKFSPGDATIDVEVRKKDDAVEIAVRDKGIGIPENEQKKIFEKFYRGKRAASVSPTGTGLGLALVRHIVHAHHGDVVIQSRPGEGTRVSIILPVRGGQP